MTAQENCKSEAGIGYRCMYPRCNERRPSFYDLIHHVERDHSEPRILEKRIIRDVHGKILALPPQLIFLYFPNESPCGATDQVLQTDFLDPFLIENQSDSTIVDNRAPQHARRTNLVANRQEVNFPSISSVYQPTGSAGTLPSSGSTPLGSVLSTGLQCVSTKTNSSPIFSSENSGTELPRLQTTCMPARAVSVVSAIQRAPPAPSPDSGRGSESSIDEASNCSPAANHTTRDKPADGAEDSNDSWTFPENYSVENIIKTSRIMAGKLKTEQDKPYLCSFEGCGKAYKNPNGIRYHSRNAHRYAYASFSSAYNHKFCRIKKTFRCSCRKKYASEGALSAHQSACPHLSSGGPVRQTTYSGFAQTTAGLTPTLHRLLSTPSQTENPSRKEVPKIDS